MIDKILEYYKKELSYDRFLSNDLTKRKVWLYRFIIIVYLIILFFGLIVGGFTENYYYSVPSFLLSLDILSSVYFKKGCFEIIDRKMRGIVKSNLKIKHDNIKKSLLKVRAKKMKKLFKKEKWKMNHSIVLKGLHDKLNWEYKMFTLLTLGLISSIVFVLNSLLSSYVKYNHPDLQQLYNDQSAAPIVVIYTAYFLILIMPTLLSLSIIKIIIDIRFRRIRELIDLFQTLAIKK